MEFCRTLKRIDYIYLLPWSDLQNILLNKNKVEKRVYGILSNKRNEYKYTPIFICYHLKTHWKDKQ